MSRNLRKQWKEEDMEKAITAVREITIESLKNVQSTAHSIADLGKTEHTFAKRISKV
jgi:hypothetical protein